MDNLITMGGWIRKARNKLDVTQEKLGYLLGISKANISHWETGKHRPPFQYLVLLSRMSNLAIPKHLEEFDIDVVDLGEQKIPRITNEKAATWLEDYLSFKAENATGFIRTNQPLSKQAFALRINTEDMLPDFLIGDDVVFDPEIKPRPGDFVLATNTKKEEVFFRKYKEIGLDERGAIVIELSPSNSDHPSRRSDRETLIIIGVMTEHRRYRK